MKQSLRNLLTDKSYLSYFLATAFSMGSSNILQFTLALYILERTGSPLIYASIFSIIILPRILLTPIGGVVGDRVKRLHLLKLLTFIQMVIMGFYTLLAGLNGEIPLVFVCFLVILFEMVEVFYNVAEASILSEIVDSSLMEEAVTLSRVDDGIVFVTTPIIGAFV